MMRKLTTSLVARLMVLAMIVFWPLNAMLEKDSMLEVATGLAFGIPLVIFMSWFIEAYRSLRNGKEASDFFILGVASLAFIFFLYRIWLNIIRWTDRPDSLVNSPVTAFIVWMMAWAWSIIVLAKGTKDGEVPDENKVMLVVGVIIGLGMAMTTIIFF